MAQTVRLDPVNPDEALLDSVVRVLRAGGVIAFPTDTVYGIGGDALLEEPVKRIYQAKTRGREKPLVLFVRNKAEFEAYVRRLPKTAERLVDTYLPGPLTLILRASGRAPSLLVSEGTIGIRIPNHDLVLKLLRRYGRPLATSSANVSNRGPALSALQVVSSLGGEVDLVVDGGKSGSRLASTVLDVSIYPPTLVRKGKLSLLSLEKVMGRKIGLERGLIFNVLFVCTGNLCRSPIAEGLLRKSMPKALAGRVEVGSAGTAAFDGSPAATYAIEAGLRRNVDLSFHRSQSVSRELLEEADLILVMEPYHMQRVLELLPEAADKVDFLKRVGRRGVKEEEMAVEDPAGGSSERYERCARDIEASLRPLVRWLEERLI